MSKALITEQYLTDIADSIRAKLGVQTTYLPSEMSAAIDSISGGGVTVESLSVTANGTYTAPAGKAYSPVVVNVSGSSGLISIAENLCYKLGGVTVVSNTLVFDSISDYIQLYTVSLSTGRDVIIEVDVDSMTLTSGTHRRFVMGTYNNGLIYRSTGVWAFYNGTWEDGSFVGASDGDFFDNCTVKVEKDTTNHWHIYKDNVLVWEPSGAQPMTALQIGSTDGQSINNAVISGIRVSEVI